MKKIVFDKLDTDNTIKAIFTRIDMKEILNTEKAQEVISKFRFQMKLKNDEFHSYDLKVEADDDYTIITPIRLSNNNKNEIALFDYYDLEEFQKIYNDTFLAFPLESNDNFKCIEYTTEYKF